MYNKVKTLIKESALVLLIGIPMGLIIGLIIEHLVGSLDEKGRFVNLGQARLFLGTMTCALIIPFSSSILYLIKLPRRNVGIQLILILTISIFLFGSFGLNGFAALFGAVIGTLISCLFYGMVWGNKWGK